MNSVPPTSRTASGSSEGLGGPTDGTCSDGREDEGITPSQDEVIQGRSLKHVTPPDRVSRGVGGGEIGLLVVV